MTYISKKTFDSVKGSNVVIIIMCCCVLLCHYNYVLLCSSVPQKAELIHEIELY